MAWTEGAEGSCARERGLYKERERAGVFCRSLFETTIDEKLYLVNVACQLPDRNLQLLSVPLTELTSKSTLILSSLLFTIFRKFSTRRGKRECFTKFCLLLTTTRAREIGSTPFSGANSIKQSSDN